MSITTSEIKDRIRYMLDTVQMAQCTASEYDDSERSIRNMQISMIIFMVNNGDGRHKQALSAHQKIKR